MATKTGTQLKTFFNTGDKPTESNFADLIDSNLNLTDGGTVAGITVFSSHITASGNISASGTIFANSFQSTTGEELDLTSTANIDINAVTVDIDATDNITLDAADDIALTTSTADGLITLHSAHTAGQAILVDANAAAGSILDIDAGILDIDVQGATTIDAASVSFGTGEVTINGKLNSGSLALRKTGMGTSLTVASGSTEAFDAIAPPFVSGLQPHIKTFLLNPHTVMHEAVFANTTTNTNMWEHNTDNSAAVASIGTATDFIHGGFTLVTGGTDGHQTALSTAAKPFKCAAGKTWWAKIRFAIDDHDGAEFFFGISEQAFDVTKFPEVNPAAGKDRVGFYKVAHDNDAVTFSTSKNAGGAESTAFDSAQTYDADGSIVTYGIHWDGTNAVRYFANKVATGTVSGPLALIHTYTTTAGIPDDSDMHLGFYLATGLGSTKTATIEFLEGAIAV